MKRNQTATKQIIKPILYIFLYVVILLLFMHFLTSSVNPYKGENSPAKKEINANENNRT